jgi:hypothetical protein
MSVWTSNERWVSKKDNVRIKESNEIIRGYSWLFWTRTRVSLRGKIVLRWRNILRRWYWDEMFGGSTTWCEFNYVRLQEVIINI